MFNGEFRIDGINFSHSEFQLGSEAQNLSAEVNEAVRETEPVTEPLIEPSQAGIKVDNENVVTTEDHPMKKGLPDFIKSKPRSGRYLGTAY